MIPKLAYPHRQNCAFNMAPSIARTRPDRSRRGEAASISFRRRMQCDPDHTPIDFFGATTLDAELRIGEVYMERYGGRSIVVSDYDPAWPATFEQERASLHAALGSLVLTIEHIGSTAVPGLAAKPIIDLQLSVRSLAEARSSCVGPLQALGYAYMPQYEARLPGELFFRKGLPGPWTHHLHVLQGDHPRWRRRLLFRDYLRSHPEVAGAYAKLKRDLAAAFDDDISGYMNAKTAFVAATLAEALGPGEQVLLDRPVPPQTSQS